MVVPIFSHVADERIFTVSVLYLDQTPDVTELEEHLVQILINPRAGVVFYVQVVEDLSHVADVSGLPGLGKQRLVFHRPCTERLDCSLSRISFLKANKSVSRRSVILID